MMHEAVTRIRTVYSYGLEIPLMAEFTLALDENLKKASVEISYSWAPAELQKGTTTEVTSAKGHFCAYPTYTRAIPLMNFHRKMCANFDYILQTYCNM